MLFVNCYHFLTLHPVGKQSIVMNVCVYVCLCLHTYLRNHMSNVSQIFLCMLPSIVELQYVMYCCALANASAACDWLHDPVLDNGGHED